MRRAGPAYRLGQAPDRFEQYYRLSADQLPQALVRQPLEVSELRFQRWQHKTSVLAAWMRLFRLPSGQIVSALTVDTGCELAEVIDLLEDCYFADVRIGMETVEDQARALADRFGADGDQKQTFLPERHEVVFGSEPAPDDCDDMVQRLIYRTDLPYQKEYSAIRCPAELNRRPGWLAAVGPYVSVVGGHAGFIKNAIFTSAVQGVSAAAQLRAIRHAAYADVSLFRSLEAAGGSTRGRRGTLERIADQLGDLELELSYSVEASADFGLLVPSLRAESFHSLYESMGLASKAATVARCWSASAPRSAPSSPRSRASSAAPTRTAASAMPGCGVRVRGGHSREPDTGLPGINATQVSPHRSMFSHHYLPVYLAVAAVLVLAVAASIALWIQRRRRSRHHRATAQWPRWIPGPENNST
jgi:hypothetical protein